MSMQSHRMQCCIGEPRLFDFSGEAVFSSFEYLQNKFTRYRKSIHRCFSLARSMGCQTLLEEKIDCIGVLSSEKEEICALGGQTEETIFRLSFWKTKFEKCEDSDSLIGYAIIKADSDRKSNQYVWYVFEAVFVKYSHENNCIPYCSSYDVCIVDQLFEIYGVLYCQQNGWNKACAQVALRSVLSRFLPDKDVEYSAINRRAEVEESQDVGEGLKLNQVEQVISSFGLETETRTFGDNLPLETREQFPYQEVLYSGVEAGLGSLLAFRLGNKYTPEKAAHVIPIFGHTFNKDEWVTDAKINYFNINERFGYMSSLNWTSSFIGHDDNFGPNFCILSHYVDPAQVISAIAVKPQGCRINVKAAEMAALHILGNSLPRMSKDNRLKRQLLQFDHNMNKWGMSRNIVLRPVYCTATKYLDSICKMTDWRNGCENDLVKSFLRGVSMPPNVLIIEFSLFQLFPANKRKLGEVVFDVSCPSTDLTSLEDAMILVRMPGAYAIFPRALPHISFPSQLPIMLPSAVTDHVRLAV